MTEAVAVYEVETENLELVPMGIPELTEANLQLMAAQAEELTINQETGKGYQEVRAAHIQVKGYSTQIKQRLDELNKPLNEQRRKNNEMADRLQKIIAPIIETLETKRIGWETIKAEAKAKLDQEERNRISGIRAKIDQIADIPTTISGMYDSAGILIVANEIKAREISTEEYCEFADEARKTRDRAHLTLLTMHDTLVKTEREEAEQAAIQAELDAKRKEQEAETKRLDEIQKAQDEKERKEREAIEAEKRKIEEAKRAEQERIEHEARKKEAAKQARLKAEVEAKAAAEKKALEKAEIERLKPDCQRMIEWADELAAIKAPVFADEKFQNFAVVMVKPIHGIASSLKQFAREAINA